MNPFNPSDKVVLVRDDWELLSIAQYSPLPKKGEVYVIRGIDPTSALGSVYLVGVTAAVFMGAECSFEPWRFRLLSEVQAENAAKRVREDVEIDLGRRFP